MYLGPKIGLNVSGMSYKNSDYLSDNRYKMSPVFAFHAGGVMYYAVNKRWGLQLEVNYIRKGREILRKKEDYVRDLLYYSYIEAPLLFRISFGSSKFRWYLNAGPHLSYLLSAKGEFSSSTLRRGIDPRTGYPIGLGGPDILSYELNLDRDENAASNKIGSTQDFNLIQMGVDVGAGIVVPIIDQGKIFFVDFRLSLTQSHIGRNEERSIDISNDTLLGYVQDFEGANRTLSVSTGFIFSIGEIYTAR